MSTTPRFCVYCGRVLPVEPTFCTGCLQPVEPWPEPTRTPPPAATPTAAPPARTASPEPRPSFVDPQVAAWYDAQLRLEMTLWKRRVRNVRLLGFCLWLPCFALFLYSRSPFAAFLTISAAFIGWRLIVSAERTKP